MKIHRKSNETQVIGRCERVMIRHDIVGVRKEKVILIVTGPFPFGLITRYTQEMSAFGLHHHRPHMGGTHNSLDTGNRLLSRHEVDTRYH